MEQVQMVSPTISLSCWCSSTVVFLDPPKKNHPSNSPTKSVVTAILIIFLVSFVMMLFFCCNIIEFGHRNSILG